MLEQQSNFLYSSRNWFEDFNFYLEINNNNYLIEEDLVLFCKDLFAKGQKSHHLNPEIKHIWFFCHFIDRLPQKWWQLYSKGIFSKKYDTNPTKRYMSLFGVKFKDYQMIDILHKVPDIFPDLFTEQELDLIIKRFKKHLHGRERNSFYSWFVKKFKKKVLKYNTCDFQKFVGLFIENITCLEIKVEREREIKLPSLSLSTLRLITTVVDYFSSEYKEWERNFLNMVDMPLLQTTYITTLYKEYIFHIYFTITKGYFEWFFEVMNSDNLILGDYQNVFYELKKLGLSYYVQNRYNEYKQITGKGKNLQFIPQLDILEVRNAIITFLNKEKVGEYELEAFTNAYLPLIIKEVVPKLDVSNNSLTVVGFTLVLWKSKYFDHYYFNENFSAFRDEIIRIFQFNCSTKYTEGNTKVVEAAKKIWKYNPILKVIITNNEINQQCTHPREKQREKYEKMREKRKNKK